MTNAGIILTQLFTTLLFTPIQYEIRTPRVEQEQVLIMSVSDETRAEWIAFLLDQSAHFSIKRSGDGFYVSEDPLKLLQHAAAVERLKPEAVRAISERTLENKIGSLWPDCNRVSVCVAPEGETAGSDSDCAVFVIAPGFPGERIGDLKKMVRDQIPNVDTEKIMVMGATRTPGSETDGSQPTLSLARQ